MHPLGRRLFYADLDDHVIHGWDLEGKKPAVQLKGHRGMVNAISLGLSGRMLLSGGGDHLGRGIEVILWDLADGRPRFILAGHERAVEAVRMHPDGRTAFSGGADGRLLVWNTADGTLRTALTDHPGGITALDLSPDGRLLVSGGSDGTIRLWDWLNGEQIRVFEGRGDRAAAVRFEPDGGGIAGALGGPEVHLWMMDWNLGRIPQPAWDKEAEGFIRAFIEGWSPASDSQGTEAEALDRDLWRILGQAGWGWLDRDRVRALATREQRPETGPKNRTEGE
jgi:WD40 repeat protein